MKITLLFSLENNKLPADYRRSFLSYFKNALSTSQPEKYEQWYGKGKTVQKPFCFDIYLDHPKFLKDCVEIAEPMLKVTVSTADPMEAIDLYNCFLSQKHKSYPLAFDNTMTLDKIRIDNVKSITDDVILVKMMQPLVLRQHDKDTNKDRYITYEDNDFSDKFHEIVNAQLTSAGIQPDDSLQIIPIKPRRTVVKVMGGKFPANIGLYQLIGKPEILDYLYQSGTGSRNSAGLGVFEVVDAKKELQ